MTIVDRINQCNRNMQKCPTFGCKGSPASGSGFDRRVSGLGQARTEHTIGHMTSPCPGWSAASVWPPPPSPDAHYTHTLHSPYWSHMSTNKGKDLKKITLECENHPYFWTLVPMVARKSSHCWVRFSEPSLKKLICKDKTKRCLEQYWHG